MSTTNTETKTQTIYTETILKAAGIPLEASVHTLSWNDEGNLEVEYTADTEPTDAL